MSDTQEILDELDLQAWFEQESIDFKLSRGASGMQINAKVCPKADCGDRRWRVYLNAETGRGNCFVCNGTFNKFSFINHYRGEEPARDTFAHIKQFISEQGWRPRRTTTAAVETGDVKMPTSFALPTIEGQNLLYLEERGVTGEMAKYFHLRFCQQGWWRFEKEDGTQGGQCFDMRVLIPVYDLDGTLKTFQGRDVTGTKDDSKYLFPKLLPGTGRYLLNGQNALGSKRVAVGEGFFDVASIKKAFDGEMELRGVTPVGTFGKHLSYGSLDGDDQLGRFIQLRNAGLEEVTFLWDGGEKELIAAFNAAKLLHGVGLKVMVAMLPIGKDPNEVLPEVVCKAFYSAVPYTRINDMRMRLESPYKHKR